MKKRCMTRPLRGYYVMSVVLGLLLAVAAATMLEVVVLDGISASSGRLNMALDDLWGYLPLNLCNIFLECRTAVAVSECLDGDHGDYVGGDFRQDVGDEGQPDEDTTGDERGNFGAAVDAGLWLGNAALDCERSTGAGAGGALMVIPLTILRKTQQPVEGGLLGVICQERIHGWWLSIKRFVRENRTFVDSSGGSGIVDLRRGARSAAGSRFVG